jgi:hypothetical protein
MQVHDCLATIRTVSTWLTKTQATPDEDYLPAEAKLSLEVTLMNACHRLDKILADDSRWSLPEIDAQRYADKLAESEVAISQQAVIATQRDLDTNRPCRNEPVVTAEVLPAAPTKTTAHAKRKSK